jgi:hypothetical protein
MSPPDPMLSSLGRRWPAGGEWVMQPKWDGFRLNSSLLRLLRHRALPGCQRAAAAGSGEARGRNFSFGDTGLCFKARACTATGARTGVQESSGCRRCPYSPGTCESCAYTLFATVPSQSVGRGCRLGAASAGGSACGPHQPRRSRPGAGWRRCTRYRAQTGEGGAGPEMRVAEARRVCQAGRALVPPV